MAETRPDIPDIPPESRGSPLTWQCDHRSPLDSSITSSRRWVLDLLRLRAVD